MSEFNIRADAVDVEQIMRQIRARIRDKRGVDYTEEQIQELARVRLEKFLDPKGLRSDLLQQFQQTAADVPRTYEFDDQTLFRSTNPLVAFIRRLLTPLLKLFFSPNPLIQAFHDQVNINRFLLERAARDVLVYEVLHNLVVEMTRTGIDVKNMLMRVESVSSRLEFNERRARALEAVVQYRPDALVERAHGPAQGGGASESSPSGVDPITGGESLRSRRRRRRRGRRSGPGFGEGGQEPRAPSNPSTPLVLRQAQDEPRSGQAQDEPRSGQAQDEPRSGQAQDERRSGQAQDERRSGQASDEPPASAGAALPEVSATNEPGSVEPAPNDPGPDES